MKTIPSKKRMNASVISLSPDFDEAVRSVRSDLGLPAGGFNTSQEREKWYKKHHAGNTKEPYRPLPRYYWHFPKEFVELVESFAYSNEPSRVNYYPNVPLDRYAMELIRKFDLPEEVVDQVKAYILGIKGSLGVGSALQPILIPVDNGKEGIKYTVLIAGIDETTTQKDWLEMWGRVEEVLRMSGMVKIPNKRPSHKLFLRDLSLWKQIKVGKTASEAAEDWRERHPEDEALGEDTVRKAVDRINKVMRPKS